MKYCKYLIFTFLNLFFLVSFSQKTLTYEGPIQNGSSIKSTARYSYYLDKNRQQIKHGSFRYLVKEKTTDSRLTQNFSGNYKNGLKDGSWEYSIKSKNYIIDAQGFAESSEIILKANYINGIPEGQWIYTANISKRKKVVENGKEQWVDFQQIKNIYIQVNFRNGILVDSLQIRDALGDSLNLFSNKNGLLDGNLLYNSAKKTIAEKFNKGFLIQKNGQKYEHYDYFETTQKDGTVNYIVDTLSLLNKTEFSILKCLSDNVFNKLYFLYEYIDGDLVFERNSRGIITGLKLEGYYYLSLNPSLSEKQSQYINDIYYYRAKVKDLENAAKRQLKGAPNDIKLKNRVEAYRVIGEEIEKYHCAAKLAKTIILPSELYRVASKNCLQLSNKFQKTLSVDKWLYDLLTASRTAWLQADKLSNQ